ncbi:hypothetical protein BS333_17495 [Vibrio azureus]|nr:hypothetical protein [Vibrio azureus]AUI88154.1 hypothetical protein BS333_17495 [Vibrio azureus]
MRLSDGKKIVAPVPAGGFQKDVPCLLGALLVVPNFTAEAGDTAVCYLQGHFDGPIRAGDDVRFESEPAYFHDSEFTKTQPTGTGDISQPVGVFIDGGVLLTGGLITEFVT